MVPTSTYRLQLRREFGFRDAAAIVPYLAELGVSHVYCSPVLQATPGSPHGYDIVDHSMLSADLGGDDGWRVLVAACRASGLGLVVDIVPNHMAVPVPEHLNAALWDVLRLGPASAYADWFDIDWDAQDGKLLMPVLGQPLTDCLNAGEITVDTDTEIVRYFDHAFPLAPGTRKLDEQHYRLAHWRVGNTQLNYRRFFDVTSLIGVCVEDDMVFAATHRRVLDLVRAGDVDGLRVDHPDGLADPAGYLDALRDAVGDRWVVVEKILEGGEALPASWCCHGTTGYDAASAITQLLVDPAGETPLTQTYAALTGAPTDFHGVVIDGKRQVTEQLFGAEVNRLVRDLGSVHAGVPEPVAEAEARDSVPEPVAEAEVRDSVRELLVHFPVYRAYPDEPASAAHLDSAVAAALRDRPDLDAEVLRAIGRSVRFAQTSGPVTAKGVEDTAFYRYHRLVALNEVGGDPGTFGRPIADWHAFCERLARDWPATMTTLSTHDTKRSEDVRARLLVLAEAPDAWREAVTRWPAFTPDPNTGYLFWQTIVGAWPIDRDRMQAYLLKATREAKQHTSWTDPDAGFEAALRRHVDAAYDDELLLADVERWVNDTLLGPAYSNSLAQKLLQLTMPGVPDVYQGQELTDFHLVDPDNRRPVDYAARRELLATCQDADAAQRHARSDMVQKLWVTTRALRLRRDRPEVFAAGGYTPLDVTGAGAEHAIAFARGDDVVTVATRLPVGLTRLGGWDNTTVALPVGEWHDVLIGTSVRSNRLMDILARMPVALLVRTP